MAKGKAKTVTSDPPPFWGSVVGELVVEADTSGKPALFVRVGRQKISLESLANDEGRTLVLKMKLSKTPLVRSDTDPTRITVSELQKFLEARAELGITGEVTCCCGVPS